MKLIFRRSELIFVLKVFVDFREFGVIVFWVVLVTRNKSWRGKLVGGRILVRVFYVKLGFWKVSIFYEWI